MVRTAGKVCVGALVLDGVLCILVGWGAGFLWQRERVTAATTGVGDLLPDGVLHMMDGRSARIVDLVSPNGLSGILVFSPACGSCGAQAPTWERISRAFGLELSLKGVAVTPDRQYLASFVRDASISFEVGRSDDSFPRAAGVRGFPTIFVVDASGRILSIFTGETASEGFSNWLGDMFDGLG